MPRPIDTVVDKRISANRHDGPFLHFKGSPDLSRAIAPPNRIEKPHIRVLTGVDGPAPGRIIRPVVQEGHVLEIHIGILDGDAPRQTGRRTLPALERDPHNANRAAWIVCRVTDAKNIPN